MGGSGRVVRLDPEDGFWRCDQVERLDMVWTGPVVGL